MLQSWCQKNCLSTGKHVIIFVTQQVTMIGAAWPAKTPLILALSTFSLKESTVKPVFYYWILVSSWIRCNLWQSLNKKMYTVHGLHSRLNSSRLILCLWLFFQMIGGQEKKDCPPPLPMPQCIGPGYFVVLIVAQLFMLIGYIGYKNQKEAAAKKFF